MFSTMVALPKEHLVSYNRDRDQEMKHDREVVESQPRRDRNLLRSINANTTHMV